MTRLRLALDSSAGVLGSTIRSTLPAKRTNSKVIRLMVRYRRSGKT